jgi:hypothetical protein
MSEFETLLLDQDKNQVLWRKVRELTEQVDTLTIQSQIREHEAEAMRLRIRELERQMKKVSVS